MRVYLMIIFLLIVGIDFCFAQSEVTDSILYVISKKGATAKSFFEQGKYEEAEKISREILELKLRFFANEPLTLAINYSNLGAIHNTLANYDDALEYFNKALNLVETNQGPKTFKASLLLNIGVLYHKKLDHLKALSFYKSSSQLSAEDKKLNSNIMAVIYSNIGIIQFKVGDVTNGTKNHLNSIELSKDNTGRHEGMLRKFTLDLMSKKMPEAGKYLKEREQIINTHFPDNKFLLIQLYIDYAEYSNVILNNSGLALDYLNRAMIIARQQFSLEHPIFNDIFYPLAEINYDQGKYINTINFLQQYLEGAFLNFKDTGILNNPELNDGNYKSSLIDILVLKSKACYKGYLEKGNLEYLDASINTIQLAIKVINFIRLRINNEESKFLISKDQINTFKLAQQVIYEKYKLTNDITYKNLAFSIMEMGRSFSLLSSIRSMKAMQYGDIPQELLKKEEDLNHKISLYTELIFNEKGESEPRDGHIKVWESYIFDLSRQYDDLTAYFEKNYPSYYSLKYDNSVISMDEVSSKLTKHDLVIEYSLTDSVLFTYLISNEGTRIFKRQIDSTLATNCMDLYSVITTQNFSEEANASYKRYISLAYDIYSNILQPIEEFIKGKNLIFIPDGAISFVPFDALLTRKVEFKSNADYYRLPYLIRENAVSTSYSSTIHFNELVNHEKMKGNILAFAPYYGRNIPEETVSKRLRQSDLDQLVRIPGVKEEVSRIAKIKPTDVFLDRRATETNFKHAAANYTILHLAMHTILDDNDPLYSKLAFTQNVDTVNDGFLHTYEIYNMKLNANLAVLSSCGSGYGDFKEGEGIQSLARGFAYAGCPSVLMTLWEVADKSTVGVMERFYFHLGKGLSKSKALQKSKLEFLEQADQLRSNPFFWASYTIIGNSEPIYPSNKWNLLMTIFLLLIPVPVVMILYRNYKKQGQKNI